MLVKKGEYSVIPEDKEEKEKKQGETKPPKGKDGKADVEFSDDPKKMEDIPKIDDETPGVKTFRDFTKGKDLQKAKATSIVSKTPSKIAKKEIKNPNWSDLSNVASSRGNLSDKAKKLLRDLKTTQPTVNWRKELKKFFDQTYKSMEWVLPNKRFLAGGDILYGRKSVGDDTLKTIVAAVDTSSSISKTQIKLFVNEVMNLVKMFDADKTIIIYCSDYIDNVDIIKKGGSPDFTKIASTGGNKLGFIPPFKWVEENKIKPSIFIYLTDTGGEMPDPSKYGIRKYIKRVIWFICSPIVYNTPPFGKILYTPVAGLK
jgi:hypothetical protein